VKHLNRSGRYFRVCDPSWDDPLDTQYSKRFGGRWNAPEEFGALYLCATILVAAANARLNYENEIATLYDLLPEQRPDLQCVQIRPSAFVDVVTAEGLRAIHLPSSYPQGISWARCQAIARRAYAQHENGVAYRSAVTVGEELAVFDSASALVRRRERLPFREWYPVEVRPKK
jgi:RES domain-containing protein